MYDDDHNSRSNLTKVVIMALISATFVISLLSFSYNADAQTFGDNNNNNDTYSTLPELFTNHKQSVGTVNIANTTDASSNTITRVVPSLITTGSYMHPYIDNTGGHGATLGIVEAPIGSQETRGFLVTETTAEGPAAKAEIAGGDLLANIKGSYIEVSRIINIPRNVPNSSSIVPNSSNQTSANIPNSSNQTNSMLTYQNSTYGITIQYPANWTKSEQDLDPNDNVTNIVAFNSPLTSRFDNYSETLLISMERLSNQNMTLKEYAASVITNYNKTLTDFNLIESNTNSTLGGGNNPAYGLIYTDREDGTNYKTLEIGTIIGGRLYYIEYLAEEEKYSDYLPIIIQVMINSLQIR